MTEIATVKAVVEGAFTPLTAAKNVMEQHGPATTGGLQMNFAAPAGTEPRLFLDRRTELVRLFQLPEPPVTVNNSQPCDSSGDQTPMTPRRPPP